MRKTYLASIAMLLVSISAFAGHGRQDIVGTAIQAGSFTTLAQALQAADLVDTLKGPGPFTVFAPTDKAFASLPPGTLEVLLKPENKEQLRSILTYHVVEGQASPEQVVGVHKTMQGAEVNVTVPNMAMPAELKINDANVVCGGVQTANATVYLIDTVLMPPM